MVAQEFSVKCQVCGGAFQFGEGLYSGRFIKYYEMSVCDVCWSANWDGWGPRAEPSVRKHMNERGLAFPERNAKGWFPRNPDEPEPNRPDSTLIRHNLRFRKAKPPKR